jgi:biopolymer transport protein ExbD
MRRRSQRRNAHQSHEFELDLAPLLAVMVKLVPVLLISSSFVQIMTLESELPGSLKAAVEQSQKENISVRVTTTDKNAIRVLVDSPAGTEKKDVPMMASGDYDYDALHNVLVEIKKEHPQVFHLVVNPNSVTPYQVVVKLMDQARKAKNPGVEFMYKDPATQTEKSTTWMFPEVVLIPGEAT